MKTEVKPETSHSPVVRVQQFWEEVFQEGQFAMIDEGFIGPAYTFNDEPQTPAQVKAFAKALWEAYSDTQVSIEQIFGDKHDVAIRWTFSGVNKKTGKPYSTTGINIVRVEDRQAFSNHQVGSLTLDGS